MIEAIMQNIETTAMLTAVLGALILVNMLLGSVMASTVGQFDIQRLARFALKGVLICASIIAYCTSLDVLPYILERAKIGIPGDMITVVEVISVLMISVTKYAKEIYQKIQTLLNITEDDIRKSQEAKAESESKEAETIRDQLEV